MIFRRPAASAVESVRRWRALSAASCEKPRTVRIPLIASSATVPAVEYAACASEANRLTRLPSRYPARISGGTESSTTAASSADV